MRGVDLAIYADALAGEAASLSARAERARSRLRQAAIEKRARGQLTTVAVERLEALGLLGAVDEAAARAELRELEAALDALEELRAWVEAELGEASAA
jgi:Spy/CpxP family protein refolding chaperone